jgi:hypothetical protein
MPLEVWEITTVILQVDGRASTHYVGAENSTVSRTGKNMFDCNIGNDSCAITNVTANPLLIVSRKSTSGSKNSSHSKDLILLLRTVTRL